MVYKFLHTECVPNNVSSVSLNVHEMVKCINYKLHKCM
jgi:hypothetical protein